MNLAVRVASSARALAAQALPPAGPRVLRASAALRCALAGPRHASPRLFSSMSAVFARTGATGARVPPHRAHFAGGRGLDGLRAPASAPTSTHAPVHARAVSSAAAVSPAADDGPAASPVLAEEVSAAYAPAWLAAFVSSRVGAAALAPQARRLSVTSALLNGGGGAVTAGAAASGAIHAPPLRHHGKSLVHLRGRGSSDAHVLRRTARGKAGGMRTPPPARGVPRYYSSTSLRSDMSTRSMGTATPHAVVIDRLDHLVLTVADLDRTVEFYERVLGMVKSEFVGTDGTRRMALEFGRQKINLHEHKNEFEPKAANVAPGSADLCFIALSPIDSVAEHVRACGVEITDGPIKRTGAVGPIMSIYMRDPDGNLIEVSNYLEAEATE